MTYRLEFTSSARRQFLAQSAEVKTRLDRSILSLVENPRPFGSKMLSGPERLYRLRVGDWRVVYQIEDALLLVTVVKLGHRREVYRQP